VKHHGETPLHNQYTLIQKFNNIAMKHQNKLEQKRLSQTNKNRESITSRLLLQEMLTKVLWTEGKLGQDLGSTQRKCVRGGIKKGKIKFSFFHTTEINTVWFIYK
jgi:hypothetical protein